MEGDTLFFTSVSGLKWHMLSPTNYRKLWAPIQRQIGNCLNQTVTYCFFELASRQTPSLPWHRSQGALEITFRSRNETRRPQSEAYTRATRPTFHRRTMMELRHACVCAWIHVALPLWGRGERQGLGRWQRCLVQQV